MLHKTLSGRRASASRGSTALEEIINAAASYEAGRRKSASLAGFLDDVLLTIATTATKRNRSSNATRSP